MLKYLFYPVFGTAVLGLYGLTASSGVDVGASGVQRSVIPAQYRAQGMYRTAPIIWRTSFHGPAAYRPQTSSGSGGVGYYGGYSGGK